MIESLNVIRSLGLAPVFEDLYFGRDVPDGLETYMRYPAEFRNTSLDDWQSLTSGGLVPIVDDGNLQEVCLFDTQRRRFVTKSIEEPAEIVQEFDSWQQYLAQRLLEIADSGLDDTELEDVASTVGFERTAELIALLDEMESMTDAEAEERAARFIRESAAWRRCRHLHRGVCDARTHRVPPDKASLARTIASQRRGATPAFF
ncbi:MAG TPA: hypothetical protein VNM47_14720 [Terriglobia bacterium]|nr:hypothetical protein [Terriglobia bacterium]